MTQAIKSLAKDRPRLARMGQRAHTTIRAHLSYEQYASWFLQMVHAAWEEPPRYWPGDRPLLRVGQSPQAPPDFSVARDGRGSLHH
jgi:hypothetical protein